MARTVLRDFSRDTNEAQGGYVSLLASGREKIVYKLTPLHTMAFATLEQLLLIVHSERDPNDAEWSRLLHHAAWQPYAGILVVTRGGGPTAKQRRELDTYWGPRGAPPIAVATDSRAARSLLTALSWFLRHPVRGFAASEVPLALKHLNALHLERDVLALIQRAEARLRVSLHPPMYA